MSLPGAPAKGRVRASTGPIRKRQVDLRTGIDELPTERVLMPRMAASFLGRPRTRPSLRHYGATMRKSPTTHPWWTFALTAAVTAVTVVIALNFVTPETRIDASPKRLYSLHDPQFKRALNSMLGPPIVAGNRVQTLRNGDEIFPA